MREPETKILEMDSWGAFCALLRRDLLLVYRTPAQMINPLAFFLIMASLFPLGISPDPKLLGELAGGIIWIGALLSVLLSMDSLFKSDQEDGSLDQLLLSPHPLPLLVLAKVVSHWLTSGLCLTLMAPLLALMLHMPAELLPALIIGLLVGTPVLSLAGAVGAALTVRIGKGSVLLTLLSLPLYIPVLIFGTGALQAAFMELPYTGHILWLAVFLVLGLCLAPLAISAALRVVNE